MLRWWLNPTSGSNLCKHYIGTTERRFSSTKVAECAAYGQKLQFGSFRIDATSAGMSGLFPRHAFQRITVRGTDQLPISLPVSSPRIVGGFSDVFIWVKGSAPRLTPGVWADWKTPQQVATNSIGLQRRSSLNKRRKGVKRRVKWDRSSSLNLRDAVPWIAFDASTRRTKWRTVGLRSSNPAEYGKIAFFA
jgi:hypothetical protein